MSLSRRKIIFALVPFAITTIAISIFLIFFYWGDISFQGASPFSVEYNGQKHSDINGRVTIHARAGSQSFVVSKDHYETQTLTTDVDWSRINQTSLHFVYQAKVIGSEPFTPSISYINPIAIDDNQLQDIVITTSKRKMALPSGINRVVWNRNGTQACLLHTGSGSTQNQFLSAKSDSFTANSLDADTFDCQTGPQNLHVISLRGNLLNIDNHTLTIPQSQDWTVSSSYYRNEVFITLKDPGNAKQTLIYWDLDTDTHTIWGAWDMTGAIHITGEQSVAIPLAKGVEIYQAGKNIFTLPITATTESIITNTAGDTMYYIDTDHEQTLKTIFQSPNPSRCIFQQNIHESAAKVVQVLSDDQSLLSARLSPDQVEAWYLFDKPTSSLLKIIIGSIYPS